MHCRLTSNLPPLPCDQAVFSRPVIALGSDFGSTDRSGSKVRVHPSQDRGI